MNKPTAEALAMTNEHMANQEANAVLMANAPKMYHLIRAWLFSDPYGTHSDACRKIIEDIEKGLAGGWLGEGAAQPGRLYQDPERRNQNPEK